MKRVTILSIWLIVTRILMFLSFCIESLYFIDRFFGKHVLLDYDGWEFISSVFLVILCLYIVLFVPLYWKNKLKFDLIIFLLILLGAFFFRPNMI
jgi:uncharacterized protein (DUF2126 family)